MNRLQFLTYLYHCVVSGDCVRRDGPAVHPVHDQAQPGQGQQQDHRARPLRRHRRGRAVRGADQHQAQDQRPRLERDIQHRPAPLS